jgi:hypothetical protein
MARAQARKDQQSAGKDQQSAGKEWGLHNPKKISSA